MKGQHVCLHFCQETWDQAIVSMVQENIFLFESTLTSAGDSLPEWIKIWNTDTSVEFNYALNIHQVLILNIKAFQGQIFSFNLHQWKTQVCTVMLLFLYCTDVTDSKFSWIFLRQCTWTEWPLHTAWPYK